MTDEKGLKLVSGLVKWFDPTKGYGFILNEEGGADILLHANVLRNFGRSSVADQSRVTVWMQPTQRGLQATEVVSIEPPISDGSAPIADLDNGIIEHLEALPLRPGVQLRRGGNRSTRSTVRLRPRSRPCTRWW